MKIALIWIGKTKESYLQEGVNEYVKRLQRYVKFDIIEIPYIKKKVSVQEQKSLEGKLLLKEFENFRNVILLDEGGKSRSSVQFSQQIEKFQSMGIKSLAFVIGGAYGYSEEVYAKRHPKLSLSELTFSHQMVRMIFTEQLYRAYTILNKEPYHHI